MIYSASVVELPLFTVEFWQNKKPEICSISAKG